MARRPSTPDHADETDETDTPDRTADMTAGAGTGPESPSQLLVDALGELAARLAGLAASDGGAGPPAPAPTLPTLTVLDGLAEGPLAELADRLRLGPVELGMLLCAASPQLDGRFGALFAAIDPDRRPLPRLDVAMAVCGANPWDPEHRAMVGETGMLSRAHLWRVDADGPMPSRTVLAHDSVVAALLGGEPREPVLDAVRTVAVPIEVAAVDEVAALVTSGFWAVWIHDPSHHLGASVAGTALASLGLPVVAVDLGHLSPGSGLAGVLPAALREATLRRGGLVVTGVDLARDRDTFAALEDPVCPLVLVGGDAWDPLRASARPASVDLAPLDQPTRREVWQRVAAVLDVAVTDAELDGLSTLRLGPGQIASAGPDAVARAVASGGPVGERHLRAAALQNGAGRLERLATHIVPVATFDDLVLPDDLLDELRAIPGWMTTRHRVRVEWGMARGARAGRGVTCLFAGPSGTGKTLAAEVVASSLGVDLYVIDLSQIVDKYIGETEKNLDRVFQEAQDVNGVLLFDEADALFSKRTDVKSSHDRNANLEVAYLLQRMDRYDGVAVLTTNLRSNIDEAFTRRLDLVCAFTEPDRDARRALWAQHLPPGVPVAELDLDLLAEHLNVTGGVIRNITMAAAHAAAIEDSPVTMRHLALAAMREFRKQGRLFTSTAVSDLVAR